MRVTAWSYTSTPGGASRDIAVEAPGLIAIYATEAWWWAARPLWVMLWGGVFERHPGLRFAITEDGAWWIPGIVQRMDEKFVGFHNTEKLGNAFRQTITRKPSEFFGTNIFVGASTPSREEVEQRHRIGVEAFMWGNDFPHPEGTWPHTRQSISESFRDVPTAEAERMLGLNAAAVYGFDVGRLGAVCRDGLGRRIRTCTARRSSRPPDGVASPGEEGRSTAAHRPVGYCGGGARPRTRWHQHEGGRRPSRRQRGRSSTTTSEPEGAARPRCRVLDCAGCRRPRTTVSTGTSGYGSGRVTCTRPSSRNPRSSRSS